MLSQDAGVRMQRPARYLGSKLEFMGLTDWQDFQGYTAEHGPTSIVE